MKRISALTWRWGHSRPSISGRQKVVIRAQFPIAEMATSSQYEKKFQERSVQQLLSQDNKACCLEQMRYRDGRCISCWRVTWCAKDGRYVRCWRAAWCAIEMGAVLAVRGLPDALEMGAMYAVEGLHDAL